MYYGLTLKSVSVRRRERGGCAAGGAEGEGRSELKRSHRDKVVDRSVRQSQAFRQAVRNFAFCHQTEFCYVQSVTRDKCGRRRCQVRPGSGPHGSKGVRAATWHCACGVRSRNAGDDNAEHLLRKWASDSWQPALTIPRIITTGTHLQKEA